MTDVSNTVCVLMNSPFEDYFGGTLQTYNQAREISKYGFEVIIVAINSKKEKPIFNVTKSEKGHLKIHSLSSCLFKNRILKYIIVTIYLFLIRKEFKILQIVTDRFCIVSAIFSMIFNKKTIMIVASYFGYVVKPGFVGKIKLGAISKIDIIVTKNRKMYRFYKFNFNNQPKIVLIPNGVDIDKYNASEKKTDLKLKLGFKKDDIIILFVGNIIKDKGIDVLINLFINNALENYRLFLVGDNNLDNKFFKSIVRRIIKARLTRNVFLFGRSRKIDLYYKIADIFILPSRREGLPNVVLEAMASKLCCIVSNLEYTNDLINFQTGYKFDLNKPKKILQIINMLKNNESLRNRIGNNARKMVEERYNIGSVAKKYIKLYQNLMS